LVFLDKNYKCVIVNKVVKKKEDIMFTIGILELTLFATVSFAAYVLGRVDGNNRGIEKTIGNLIAQGFLKYRETSNGRVEFVPHPNR